MHGIGCDSCSWEAKLPRTLSSPVLRPNTKQQINKNSSFGQAAGTSNIKVVSCSSTTTCTNGTHRLTRRAPGPGATDPRQHFQNVPNAVSYSSQSFLKLAFKAAPHRKHLSSMQKSILRTALAHGYDLILSLIASGITRKSLLVL